LDVAAVVEIVEEVTVEEVVAVAVVTRVTRRSGLPSPSSADW